MSGAINRKAFVTALGAAGLGLGLTVTGAGRSPAALAQDATPPDAPEDAGPLEQRFEERKQLYAEFTAALATELNVANADDVDAGIRKALMTVIDGQVGDGMLTAGQAEALKTLVATSDVPFAPLAMAGRPPGVFIHHHRGGHPGPPWGEREWGGGSGNTGDSDRGESTQEGESES
jgi:hypothetical protein